MSFIQSHIHIGKRIIKSAISVGICFLIYVLRGYQGIPFYSALACLQCIQPYQKNTKKIAIQRVTGTFVGALYGLILIQIQSHYPLPYLLYCFLISLGVVCSIKTAVSLNKKNAAYFSCVVFLSITMMHIGDENPNIFVLNRVTDTLIGVAIGMIVNNFRLPMKKHTDTLFVTGLDDVLLERTSSLTDYGRIELNRLIDEGLPLSIMTMRTLASFLEAVGEIHIQLPVILMDGAALYDPVEHKFLSKKEMTYDQAQTIIEELDSFDLPSSKTIIMDDSVMIYHDDFPEGPFLESYKTLRKSPYRNYVNREIPSNEMVTYIMCLDKKDKIQKAKTHIQNKFGDQYRLLSYSSDDYPGYAYLKVYNPEATKLNMLKELQEYTGHENVKTFGSIANIYDTYVPDAKGDTIVHHLKKSFLSHIGQKER